LYCFREERQVDWFVIHFWKSVDRRYKQLHWNRTVEMEKLCYTFVVSAGAWLRSWTTLLKGEEKMKYLLLSFVVVLGLAGNAFAEDLVLGSVPTKAGALSLQEYMKAASSECHIVPPSNELQCTAVFRNTGSKDIQAFGLEWHYIDEVGHFPGSLFTNADMSWPDDLSGQNHPIQPHRVFRVAENLDVPEFQPVEVHAHLRFVEFTDGSVVPESAREGESYRQLLESRESQLTGGDAVIPQ
jgi:hypothetical protein